MKILVTGGCGFIGSHIVDQLRLTRHSVRILDRNGEKFRQPLPDVEYHLGDFTDPATLYPALAGIDMVIHLASATVPSTAELNPQADVRGNLLATIALMEAMGKCNVSRIIYFSSGGTVYGMPKALPTPEDHPLVPMNSYGIVKAAIEHYIRLFERTRGLTPTIIRPSNPYGPRQGKGGVQGLVSTVLHRIMADEHIDIWGDGTTIRDYIYVEDLAHLCIRIVERQASGTYNAGSGHGVSINGLIDMIERSTGRPAKLRRHPARNFDVPVSTLDISRARDQLAWEPTFDLNIGLTKTWDWLADFEAGRHHS